MRKYTLNTELTLTQVLQLRGLAGAMSSLTNVVEEATVIIRKEGITDSVRISDYIRKDWFDHLQYQDACDKLGMKASRTVTIGGKKYYEDELAVALASIKEVKS